MDESNNSQILIDLERRIARIEKVMFGASAKAAAAPPPSDAPTVLPHTPSPVSRPNAPIPGAPIPTVSPRPEGAGAGALMGFVAGLCFVGAALFLIKLAIVSGWLNPERQIILAGLFGFGLIGFGLFFRKKDAVYLSLLPGAGVIVLDLAVVGGHLIYDLFSAETSVALVGFVSVIALFLYSKFESEIYSCLAAFGSYSSLFLLGVHAEPATLTTYYLCWSAIYSVIAVRMESKVLLMLSAYLALGGYQAQVVGFAIAETGHLGSSYLPLPILVQAIQFLLFAGSRTFYSVSKRSPLTQSEVFGYFPLLVFFYGIEYYLLYLWDRPLAPWIAIGFAVLLQGLYRGAKARLKESELHSSSIVAAFTALVFLHAIYWNILSDRAQLWLAPLLIVIVPIAATKFSRLHKSYLTVAGLIVAFGYFQTLLGASMSVEESITLSAVFTVVLVAAYVGIRKWQSAIATKTWDSTTLAVLLLVAAAGQFGFGSTRFYGWLGNESELITNFRPFFLSATWGLVSLFVLWFSLFKRDSIAARVSLLMLAFTAFKVLFYDASSSSTVVRILCLLITGVVLYAGGYLLRRINTWSK